MTNKLHQQKNSPRLEPIENPDSLKIKFAYWISNKEFGKVITPLKVLYSRFPKSFYMTKTMFDMEDKFTIKNELQLLIQTYAATLNNCAFCIDIKKASLQKEHAKSAKLNELLKFEESHHFTNAEKAALAYVGEATLDKHIKDTTFDRLTKHYTEKEIVQITMINAIENYHNLMNAPMNIPSDELCEPWSKNIE